LNLSESDVRVVCFDVGGSFGIKVHAYPDDFATVGISILLKRPVKYVADRLESYLSDFMRESTSLKAVLPPLKMVKY
jgi:carbon-monoxide dehydrogenase large subunit